MIVIGKGMRLDRSYLHEMCLSKKTYLKMIRILLMFLSVTSVVACTSIDAQTPSIDRPSERQFNDYWYAGDGEITRYELQQARYGEVHNGDAVLIFVTEPFDTKSQVKHERGPSDANTTSVLKMNYTKKFNTGLYPYSMMTSVFTPRDGSKTMKVNTTSQEWCGHTFEQLNLRNGQYEGRLFSYFQSEGDVSYQLDNVLLEDEVWTKLRLDPTSLPTGNIKIIPGSQYLRLAHLDHKSVKATATLTSTSNEEATYTIDYEGIPRKLSITFEQAFPYVITSWTEEVQSGWGAARKTLKTTATRTHSIKSPYWSKHDVADGVLRKELGLE